jgi:hypothetical protein
MPKDRLRPGWPRVNERLRLKMFVCAKYFESLHFYEFQRLFLEAGTPERRTDSSRPKGVKTASALRRPFNEGKG